MVRIFYFIFGRKRTYNTTVVVFGFLPSFGKTENECKVEEAGPIGKCGCSADDDVFVFCL